MSFLKPVLSGLSVFIGLAAVPAAAELASHRAVYDLKSSDVDRRSGIISAEGRLAYEITGSACDGWSTSYRIATRYVKAEGVTQLTDTQVTAWEAGDGSELQVTQKQYNDQSLQSETSMSAKIAPGKEGTARMTRPTEKSITLPAGTLFSVAQQSQILKSASNGEKRFSGPVFEGSGSETVYDVVNLIGDMKPDASFAAIVKDVKPMSGMKAWSVSSAYYPLQDTAAGVPEYQSSFVMFENGVSTNVVFDYGNYQLRGELMKLELLPVEKCP